MLLQKSAKFKISEKITIISNSSNFLEKNEFRAVQRSALCRSRRELSNAYLLAKFGFDTAENEPSKVCHLNRVPTSAAAAATEGAGCSARMRIHFSDLPSVICW